VVEVVGPPGGRGCGTGSGGTVDQVADDAAAPLGPETLRPLIPLLAGVAAVSAVLVEPGTLVENIVAVAAVVPFAVWAWRGFPTVVLVAIVAAVELYALRSDRLESLLFLVCVAATIVGGWEPSRLAVVVAGLMAVAIPVVVEAAYADRILYGVWVMGVLLPLGLGRGFRWQLNLANQLAAARQELARQAVLDEKRRIARDVHDLVGHGLASVLLHVTGARHVLRRDVDEADAALADAEAVGRRSLQELRRTLAVLRSSEPPVAGATPLPGAAELADVVKVVQSAGLDVDFRVEGDLQRVDPIVGLSLHRVAEEALANVGRHMPEAVTDVVLAVEEDTVALTVDSIGRIDRRDSRADRPRFGIIGMRERMAAVGGELEAGPTPAGWLVRCRAPLTATEVAPKGDVAS
jgi:signal transduction histidine kinase